MVLMWIVTYNFLYNPPKMTRLSGRIRADDYFSKISHGLFREDDQVYLGRTVYYLSTRIILTREASQVWRFVGHGFRSG
jgi:hypothetical protein